MRTPSSTPHPRGRGALVDHSVPRIPEIPGCCPVSRGRRPRGIRRRDPIAGVYRPVSPNYLIATRSVGSSHLGPVALRQRPQAGSSPPAPQPISVAYAVNAAYKSELIHRGKPWRSVDDRRRLPPRAWVAWYQYEERLHASCVPCRSPARRLRRLPRLSNASAEYARRALKAASQLPRASQPRPSQPHLPFSPPTYLRPHQQNQSSPRLVSAAHARLLWIAASIRSGEVSIISIRRGCGCLSHPLGCSVGTKSGVLHCDFSR